MREMDNDDLMIGVIIEKRRMSEGKEVSSRVVWLK